jgi:hypothetical protein
MRREYMTAVKKKFAKVQSSVSFFRCWLWPYYKHPRWLLHIIKERDYYLKIVKQYNEETFKDEVVLQLQTELNARKAAYDEAEAQFDEEIEDLRQELATVYAKNADLWARIAQLLAGGDPHEVQP